MRQRAPSGQANRGVIVSSAEAAEASQTGRASTHVTRTSVVREAAYAVCTARAQPARRSREDLAADVLGDAGDDLVVDRARPGGEILGGDALVAVDAEQRRHHLVAVVQAGDAGDVDDDVVHHHAA